LFLAEVAVLLVADPVDDRGCPDLVGGAAALARMPPAPEVADCERKEARNKMV
jgi:hypothetical protein